MSKNREQSAIDAIYDLLDEFKEIRKEIQVIDNNIKLLNNKISKLSQAPPVVAAPKVSLPAAAPAAGPMAALPPQTPKLPESVQNIKLFGRIKNQARKPIKGVYIKVYDPAGNVIKSRETDSEGYWEARVNPGAYVVELNATHINKKFLPKNINVAVDETMNEFEVK